MVVFVWCRLDKNCWYSIWTSLYVEQNFGSVQSVRHMSLNVTHVLIFWKYSCNSRFNSGVFHFDSVFWKVALCCYIEGFLYFILLNFPGLSCIPSFENIKPKNFTCLFTKKYFLKFSVKLRYSFYFILSVYKYIVRYIHWTVNITKNIPKNVLPLSLSAIYVQQTRNVLTTLCGKVVTSHNQCTTLWWRLEHKVRIAMLFQRCLNVG